MPSEATGTSPSTIPVLQKLSARWKVLFVIAFVISVVATPIGQWRILGSLGLVLALAIGLSGASVRSLLGRWLGFLFLIGFITLTIAPGLSARSGQGMATVFLSVLAKNSLAFLMMLVLGAVTPWPDLLKALRGLGVPVVLVSTLQFMERYVHVLRDESRRMITARRARSFGRGRGLNWKLLTSLIGMLLLRSFERSDRVYAAMLARGWDGTMRGLED